MAKPYPEHRSQRDGSAVSNSDFNIQTTVAQGSEIYQSRLLDQLTATLGILFDGTIVFLSGGIPYWYYRLLHSTISTSAELGDTSSIQVDHRNTEQWSDLFRQLANVWKTHQLIIGVVSAPMFPLLSVSPLPKCSWAYIFAILCHVYGSITFTFSIIHRVYFYNIDVSELRASSYITADSSFFDRDVLHLYVSLSLPTVWFSGFVASFALTILLIMVGVQASHDHLEIDPSCNNNSKFLLAMVPIIVVIAVISFVRSIKCALKKSQGAA